VTGRLNVADELSERSPYKGPSFPSHPLEMKLLEPGRDMFGLLPLVKALAYLLHLAAVVFLHGQQQLL
jgi:hypothetical protein